MTEENSAKSEKTLSEATEAGEICSIIAKIVKLTPPERIPAIKSDIASLLHMKYLQEIKQSGNDSGLIDLTDSKYRELANFLRGIDRPKLPAKVNSNLGATLIKGFLSSKKTQIFQLTTVIILIGFIILLYNKFFAKKNEKLFSREDFRKRELESIEKTSKALQQIRSLSQPTTAIVKKSNPQVKDDFVQDEKRFLQGMDNAIKILNTFPKKESSYKFPAPTKIDFPTWEFKPTPFPFKTTPIEKPKSERTEKQEVKREPKVVTSKMLLDQDSSPDSTPSLIPKAKRVKKVQKFS